MNKTPWFDWRVKPVREGVYEVMVPMCYAYWNGSRWGHLTYSVKHANYFRKTTGASQYKNWRGLTKE